MAEASLNFKEVNLDIEYDYQPYEKPVMYYSDGSGYPGCAEEICVTKVIHCGEDITDLCEPHLKRIEELIGEEIHKKPRYDG